MLRGANLKQFKAQEMFKWSVMSMLDTVMLASLVILLNKYQFIIDCSESHTAQNNGGELEKDSVNDCFANMDRSCGIRQVNDFLKFNWKTHVFFPLTLIFLKILNLQKTLDIPTKIYTISDFDTIYAR